MNHKSVLSWIEYLRCNHPVPANTETHIFNIVDRNKGTQHVISHPYPFTGEYKIKEIPFDEVFDINNYLNFK